MKTGRCSTNSWITIVLATALLVFLVVGVQSTALSEEKAKPIKIGALISYTGAAPVDAMPQEYGIRLALSLIDWKIGGRPIELIPEDDGLDPVVGIDKVRKLIEVDKVDAIIGGLNVGIAMAAAQFTAESKTPFLTVECGYREMLEFGDNFFIPGATLAKLTWNLGQYAATDLGYKKAVTITEDLVHGKVFADGFRIPFEKNGGKVIQEIRVPLLTMDYTPYFSRIDSSADVVYWWVLPSFVPRFVSQYYNSGPKIPVVLGTTCGASPMHLKETGAMLAKLNAHAQSSYTLLIDNPVNKEFRISWLREYGGGSVEYGEEHGVCAYTSTLVLLEAIRLANYDTSHDALNAAIPKVKNLQTPLGVLSMSDEKIGTADRHVCKLVETPHGYLWQPVKTFSQEFGDVPEEYREALRLKNLE